MQPIYSLYYYENILTNEFNSNHAYNNKKYKQIKNLIKYPVEEIQNLQKLESAEGYDSIEQFTSKFIDFYNKIFANLHELKLSEKEISNLVKKIYKFTNEVEFNGEFFFNDQLFHSLKDINKKMQRTLSSKDTKILQQIINLLFITTSITPVLLQITPKSTINKKSIEVFIPKMLNEILISIRIGNLTLSENPFLSHITAADFDKASFIQKLVLLNLCNFNDLLREEILQDKTFQSIYKRDDNELIKWMLACSGSLEQNYLNTCVPAVFCQDLLNRALILPELVIVSRHLVRYIEKESAKIDKDSKLKEYVDQRILQQSKALQELNDNLLNIPRNSNEENLHLLTLRWSQIMQKLGLLINPQNPAHPTTKPISDQWLVSCVIMTPVVLGEHLGGKSSNPPSMGMRLKGISIQNLYHATPFFYHGIPTLKLNQREKEIIGGKAKNVTKTESQEALMKLWKNVYLQGGINISSPGHALYLRTFNYKNELFFLVSDPKCQGYELKTAEKFLDYIKKNNIDCFNDE